MADNKIEFIINIGGTAYKGVAALDAVVSSANINNFRKQFTTKTPE